MRGSCYSSTSHTPWIRITRVPNVTFATLAHRDSCWIQWVAESGICLGHSNHCFPRPTSCAVVPALYLVISTTSTATFATSKQHKLFAAAHTRRKCYANMSYHVVTPDRQDQVSPPSRCYETRVWITKTWWVELVVVVVCCSQNEETMFSEAITCRMWFAGVEKQTFALSVVSEEVSRKTRTQANFSKNWTGCLQLSC